MNNATFDQAFQVLNVIRQKKPDIQDITNLLSSGLLSDLLDANIPKIKRNAFRQFLGLLSLDADGVLDICPGRNLEWMLSYGNFGNDGSRLNFHPDITTKHFPYFQKGGTPPISPDKRLEYKLFHLGVFTTFEETKNKVTSFDAEQPWNHATIEELLHFAFYWPLLQNAFPIVALGSVAEIDQCHLVPVLCKNEQGRYLDLVNMYQGFAANRRILAVREINPQSVS